MRSTINQKKQKSAVCTRATKKHLAYAKTLADSLFRHNPDIDFHLLIIDMQGLPFEEISQLRFSLVDPRNIMPPARYNSMSESCSMTELGARTKPFLLRHMIECGYEKILYLDPDIYVVQSISEILTALDEKPIILTSCHFPIPFSVNNLTQKTSSKKIKYTIGDPFCIGVRAGRQAISFLDWWIELPQNSSDFLKTASSSTVSNFWFDLIVQFFPDTTLFLDIDILAVTGQGCTQQHVNIKNQSQIKKRGTPMLVYFKGYDPDIESVCPYRKHDCIAKSPVQEELCRHYAAALRSNGHDRCKDLSYTPGIFSGINIAGYLTAELGVGEAARGYIASLSHVGIDLACLDFCEGTKSRKADTTLSSFSHDNPYPINIICVNAAQTEHFVKYAGEKYFYGKVNVGVWWWEMPVFPKIWESSFQYFDYLWVGSTFVGDAVRKASPVPVICVPPVVEVHIDDKKNATKEHFQLDPTEFIFLFIFDFFSVFERKNPLTTVHAFKEAFSPEEPVRLVLKCINEEHDPENLQKLNQAIKDVRITLLRGYLSREETNALIAAADCYISLHRSEGFGYTMAEAMFCGKPVIATRWSGNMDYMTDENSYLVDYCLVELACDYGPYKQGQVWAEPDKSHAAALMRRVFDNPIEASIKGKKAALDIRNKYSVQAVGDILWKQLAIMQINASQQRRKHRKHFYSMRRRIAKLLDKPFVRGIRTKMSKCLPHRLKQWIKSHILSIG